MQLGDAKVLESMNTSMDEALCTVARTRVPSNRTELFEVKLLPVTNTLPTGTRVVTREGDSFVSTGDGAGPPPPPFPPPPLVAPLLPPHPISRTREANVSNKFTNDIFLVNTFELWGQEIKLEAQQMKRYYIVVA